MQQHTGRKKTFRSEKIQEKVSQEKMQQHTGRENKTFRSEKTYKTKIDNTWQAKFVKVRKNQIRNRLIGIELEGILQGT